MNIISYVLIGIIKIYKFFISPYLTPTCRYLPTCSDYTIECLKTYGLLKGIVKSTKRILSCHPIKILGSKSGYDPAPDLKKEK